MKVIVTGANGMVARAAIRHCLSLGDDVVGLTRAELDISDRDAVFQTINSALPHAVLNCAAYTNVDGAELNIEQCRAANVTGVESLAIACKKQDAVFVTISTDYVFDGRKDGFYTQDDVPCPQGVYAKSKLEGEKAAAAVNENAVIVRSGWIYGESGTNFLSVMHRFLDGGTKIKAIHDSYGTPTFAADLAIRLRELAEARTSGIYHAANAGEGTSYFGFAEKVCEIGGFDKFLIEPVSEDDLNRPAPRPANSRLRCVRSEMIGLAQLPDWQDALRRFLIGTNK